jgi:hypothetical protein
LAKAKEKARSCIAGGALQGGTNGLIIPTKRSAPVKARRLNVKGVRPNFSVFEDSVQQPRIFQLFGYDAIRVLSPTKVLIKTNLSIAEQTSSYFQS